MQLTKEEISVSAFVILKDEKNQECRIPIGEELKMASGLLRKIQQHIDKESGNYVAGEVEMSDEEKKYLLQRLERPWNAIDGLHILSFMEKLK